MRLFIAARLSDDAKKEILKAEDAIRDQGVQGNFTEAANLHLTLAFIGEYPNPAKVLAAMRKVPFRPFEISLSKIGCFGDLWWCGLDCPLPLFGYVNALRMALVNSGIPVDTKKFKAHVTLLRRADREFDVPEIVEKAAMTVKEIYLMRSDRAPSGRIVYTPVGSVRASEKQLSKYTAMLEKADSGDAPE